MTEGEAGGAAAAAAPHLGEDRLKNAGLLQAQQREVLRQRLAERQRELEAKKQRLALLQQEQNAAAFTSDAHPFPTSTAAGSADIGKSVASLMGEVMSSLKSLEKPAAAAAAAHVEKAAAAAGPAPVGVPLHGKGTAAAAADASRLLGTTATGAHALPAGKPAGLAFKLQRLPSEEAVIKPKVMTTFEKSVQADLPPLAGGGAASSSAAAEAEEQQQHAAAAGVAAGQRQQQQQQDSGGDTEEPKLVVTEDELLAAAADSTAAGVLEGISSSSRSKETAAETAKQQGTPAAASPRPAALPEEERKRVMQTPEFEEFFDRTSKMVERLLGQEDLVEAFVEYPGLSASSEGAAVAGEKLVLLSEFCWKKNEQRVVLDLRCSPHFPGVFLAAYGGAPGAAASAADVQGSVLLWSLAMTQRPEYILTSQSQVCGSLFNRFQPSIIIGGTYAGNIVVWDCRAQSKPVQRSPISTRAHAHPVYSLEMVGTKNSHNVVSVDTDGRLCVWSLQMLGAPTETLDLKRGNKDICVESIAFQENEVNTLFLGTEDGALLQANIHRNKSGVQEAYEAHSGAITSVRFHPVAAETGQRDYSSDMMLTTSVDWTIKLWRSKHTFSKPLHVFDNYEAYTYDAAWHPSNPAVFAAVDGEGHLDLWNLAADWEAAAYRVGGAAAAEGLPPAAKTKVAWSSDGRRVVAGDARGHVEVWNVSNEYLQPRAEDLDNFDRRLEEALPATAPGNLQLAHEMSPELLD